MRILLVIVASTLFLKTFSQERIGDNWTLIYENDSDGNAVYGNINDLIDAIRNGKSIRISWYHQDSTNNKIKVEHLTNAKYLTIMSDKTVFAQIDPIIGQIPDFDQQQIILKENLEWSLVSSTNGKNDQMTRNVLTGEIIDHKIRNWGTSWFVSK